MEENYFIKNNDSQNFTAKPNGISSVLVKNKKQPFLVFLSIFLMIFLGIKMNGQTTTVTISTIGAGTWKVPAGVTGSFTVEAWGAGGSGGGVNGISLGGSGGTGGTYVKSTFSGVTAGTIYNLYVAPTTNPGTLGAAGLNGANSWFNTATILNANGGIGGKGGTSNGLAVTAITTGSLGTGTGTSITAGGSTAAATVANGSTGGAGGYSGGAGGAAVGGSSNNNYRDGNFGNSPGGGGGGSTVGGGSGSLSYGGVGGRGEIRITFTCPTYTVSAGSNQTLTACATTTTLSGSAIPIGTIGKWSVVSGTAAITTPSSATSGVTGLIIGSTATLRWAISNGDCGTTSSDVTITTTAGPGCLTYCTPTYSVGPGTGDQITNVTLGTLNNTSGASVSPFYTLYNTVTKPNLLQSSIASISVTFGNDANQYAGVWIDFNQNGIFEATEGTVSAVNAGANGTTVINIPVPAGAILGNTRMRVRGGNDSILTTSQACGATTSTYGETEDYIINITSTPIPTITSLGSTSGCAGTSITINGTNFTGATAANIKIGGTAVSSITSNTGTQIIGVIGAGTTGTVTVTTYGGATGTSSATFTVNPLPLITGQPATPAVACAGASTTTISVTATGASTYQWQKNGVNISNTAPYSGTSTATLTITNPTIALNGENFRVIVSNAAGCAVTSNAITLSVTAPTVISSSPVNTTIAPGANATFTTAATNSPTSYLWEVSTNSGTSWSPITNTGVYSNATTASLKITAALLSMNSYRYRVTAINACGNSSPSIVAVLSVVTYCNSIGQTTTDGITGINFNTINNLGTAANVAYSDYTSISTTVIKGNSYNLNLYINTGGSYTNYQSVYIDWNGNGDFTDAGEFYNLGTVNNSNNRLSSLCPLPILIPTGAVTGSVRMRVQSKYLSATTGPCQSNFDGEVEDYTLNIIDLMPCTTPSTQPTGLVLTASTGGTTITGTFTATAPAPDSYLVVISTSSAPPTPVNATTYSVGGTVETGGYLLVKSDNSTSFTATGLSPGTKYYTYIFSFNGLCSGGPLYNIILPLSGNITTTTVTAGAYCTPITSNSASRLFIKDVAFLGTLQDVSNYNNSHSTATPIGYQDFTGLAKSRQAQGEGINIYVGGANSSSANRGHWKAWVDWNKDGTFSESSEKVYDSGDIATSTTTFGFVIPPTAAPGDYRIRIRVYNSYKNGGGESWSYNFTACEIFSGSGGWNEYGEAEDYLFTVEESCPAIIKSVTNGQSCGSGPIALAATGSIGTTSFLWYSNLTGGTALATTPTGSWTTLPLSATTTYYVTTSNGNCESKVRTAIEATVNPIPTLTFSPAAPQVCGEDNVIALSATGDKQQIYLINENFENGLNGFTNLNLQDNGAIINGKTAWQIRTSTFVPSENVWFPAISSGFGTNKFVMSTSDVVATNYCENALISPVVNTTGFLNLTLSLKIYYSSYLDETSSANDYVTIEINDGTGWTLLRTYTTDRGFGTKFELLDPFNLPSYIDKATLRVRVRYYGNFVDGVAIDDFKLYGDKPLSTSFNWTSATPVDAYSDSACLITYKAGTPTASVYIKPTLAQLEQGTFTFTATSLLSNGCSAGTPITVTNTTKIWQGTSTDWNSLTNWLPSGVPTSSNCVIIPATTVIPDSNYNAFAKNLTVKSTGDLTLSSTSNLTVTDFVKVNTNGIFNIKDKANLIQINNTPNTGIVNIERISQPMYNIDYTYWNSPVTLASNFTLGSLSPNSPLMFSWIPTVSAGKGGNWKNENNTTVMDPSKGYIVRAPTTFSSSIKTPYTATFKGTPNNGIVTSPIIKGTLTGVVDVDAENDEWNLIGNPYPSAIDAGAFVDFNANLNVIDGTIYVWTHNTAPSAAEPDPFYGDYTLNYTENDYASFNRTGVVSTRSSAITGGSPPSGFIASGQSFFVRAAKTMAPGTTLNATFNNSMRVGVEGKNGDFFKTSKNEKNERIPKNVSDIERHRIWLNLTNNSGAFSQILVGYIEGATQGLDRSFDGESFGGNNVGFHSIIPEAQLTIQGRALPFDENDQVKLGYYSEISGKLSVRIDHLDGLFDNQNILLEDKELGIIHDLKDTPYVFQTEIGDFEERFVLRFTDKSLAINDLTNENTIIIHYTQSTKILNIANKTPDNTIESVSLYDIQGKLISNWEITDKEQTNIKIQVQNETSGVYIVKLKTTKGNISKKIIIK